MVKIPAAAGGPLLRLPTAQVHRIASRWPQDFVGLAFVYICLLAPQVTISQLLTNSPQNLRPTGRNRVYRLRQIIIDFYLSQVYADVGLVRAERRIEFSAHVLPVCLPFRPIDDIDALENDFVNLAGWGVNPQGQITNQERYTQYV